MKTAGQMGHQLQLVEGAVCSANQTLGQHWGSRGADGAAPVF